jgi:hypothetical protein
MGTRKTNEGEPLMTCREKEMASKPGRPKGPGMSLAGARLLARRCPACRWRESGLRLLCGTREGARPILRLCRVGVREGACQAAGTARH